MAEASEQDKLTPQQRWVAQVAELQTARRQAGHLARLLASDPGGRLAERARDLAERLSLMERAAVDMLALAERNQKDAEPRDDTR